MKSDIQAYESSSHIRNFPRKYAEFTCSIKSALGYENNVTLNIEVNSEYPIKFRWVSKDPKHQRFLHGSTRPMRKTYLNVKFDLPENIVAENGLYFSPPMWSDQLLISSFEDLTGLNDFESKMNFKITPFFKVIGYFVNNNNVITHTFSCTIL